MTFPVESTAVETAATKRTLRVLQRLDVAKSIDHAGVYSCRKISGSDAWSDHSWGAAADLFPSGPAAGHAREREAIAHALVYQSTHRTKANRGRKLVTRYVIDHSGRRIWTPGVGWRPYTGTTGDHVHVSTGPDPGTVPPCAG